MVLIETALQERSAQTIILLHNLNECLAQLLDLSVMETLGE